MGSAPDTPTKPESPDPGDNTRIDENSDDDEAPSPAEGTPRTGPKSSIKNEDGAAVDHAPVDQNTNYSLFSNPPDLALSRQRLFEVKEQIEMSPSDFEAYFPFVDNVWRLQKGGEATGSTVRTYWCRLKSSGAPKPTTPKPVVEGKQQRRKRKREEKTCQMAINVRHVSAPVQKVVIEPAVPPGEQHSHDLDYMDSTKRNSAIMDVARREAVRGFLPGSVFWKMQEEPDKMNEAGGRHMKISDVRNVQYAWRQQNQDFILKAHAGYNQQRSGPRQRPPSSPATTLPKRPASPISQPPPPPPPPAPAPAPAPAPVPVPAPAPAPVPAPSYYTPPQPPPQPQIHQHIPPNTLQYPNHAREFLEAYLPTHLPSHAREDRPHITLTYATSLDSRIALAPGQQTAISGIETKAMTHYLRSRHDAILIGVNTALTDNPGLNCRLAGAGGFGGPPGYQQPRPIIIDPRARLPINPAARLLQAAHAGQAKGPWIVVGPNLSLDQRQVQILKQHGGEYLMVNEAHTEHGLDWAGLFDIFHREGIRSVMVEGGGRVLSELLRPQNARLVDSLILTIAPTFFGRQGVQVSPETTLDDRQTPVANRLVDVRWQPMGEQDVVLCGRMAPMPSPTFLPGIQEFSSHAHAHAHAQTNGAARDHPVLPPLPPPPPPPASPPHRRSRA